jgi:Fe-S-cluster-containing dehydrogenase component
MGLKIDSLKCIACCACELACGYHWDEALSPITSSIIVYRAREKKNYFGIMLKKSEHLILGKPEGLEIRRIGEVKKGVEADPSAKPIMLRDACDLCEGRNKPLCVEFCPTGALYME